MTFIIYWILFVASSTLRGFTFIRSTFTCILPMSEEAVASLREEFESLRTDIKAFMIAQKQTEGGDPDREQPPEGDTPPTPGHSQGAEAGAPGPAADSLLEASATVVTDEFITLKDSLKSLRLPK